MTTRATADCTIVSFGATPNGPNVRFKQSDGKLYAAVGTTFGATGQSFTDNTWTQIDYDFNVNTGGNDFCDARINGVDCGQATAAGVSAGATVDSIGHLDAGAGSDWGGEVDDYIWGSTAADYPFGGGKVLAFIPQSDGTHNVAGADDFEDSATGTDITNATTTAWQLVSPMPLSGGTPSVYIRLIAPLNATDYVEVKYAPNPSPSTPTPNEPLRVVEVTTAHAAVSATTNNLRLALVDNATVSDVRNATVGSTTCVYSRKAYATPPSGGIWNLYASGDGAFPNLRMRCFTNDANPDPFFVGTVIEAEFSQGPTRKGPLRAMQAVKRGSLF
jgi:hypothetical protein